MISKELLSYVLGDDLVVFNHMSYPHGNGVRYRVNVSSGAIDWINIHELAHKCKEWAETKGFDISSNLVSTMITSERTRELFTADTEPEAIFKACEWILNESN